MGERATSTVRSRHTTAAISTRDSRRDGQAPCGPPTNQAPKQEALKREPRIIPDFRVSERFTRDAVNYRFLVGFAPLRADISEATTDVLLQSVKNLSLRCFFVRLHARPEKASPVNTQCFTVPGFHAIAIAIICLAICACSKVATHLWHARGSACLTPYARSFRNPSGSCA
jgi:hypothetical protein